MRQCKVMVHAKELINRSFLSDKLKKYYWQSFNYRRVTLSF